MDRHLVGDYFGLLHLNLSHGLQDLDSKMAAMGVFLLQVLLCVLGESVFYMATSRPEPLVTAMRAFQPVRIGLLLSLHSVRGDCEKKPCAAKEDQCCEQMKDLSILMLASQKGISWSTLEPQLALAFAQVACNTLMAEEEKAKPQVNEFENLLVTLKDTLDDSHA